MMQNSTRSGAVTDDGAKVRKEPTARDADRTGKAGSAVENRSFTIQPKTAVIEIAGGRVTVKVGRATGR
jgi:hypothetical protein